METLTHQKEALDEIVSRASVYFRGDWRDLPVQPRWASLMIGPTGTGKTAVASIATRAVGASLFRVSAPSWMPSGANNRSTKETISVIADHVARHDRTILFVDEVDKLVDQTGDSSWKSYVRSEVFDLLDGRWSAGLTLPETDDDQPDITIEQLTIKLRSTVYILSAGTFQDWFDSANTRRSMGFGAEIDPETHELSADIIAEKMPRELANRFNSTLIRIPELRAEDYARIAREAIDKLPERMRAAFRVEISKRITGAISAKKGVRFLEEAMMATLINLPPRPEIVSAIVKTSPAIPTLDLCTL